MTNLRNKASHFKRENLITFAALLEFWLIITLVHCLARLDSVETKVSPKSIKPSKGKGQTQLQVNIRNWFAKTNLMTKFLPFCFRPCSSKNGKLIKQKNLRQKKCQYFKSTRSMGVRAGGAGGGGGNPSFGKFRAKRSKFGQWRNDNKRLN